MFELWTRLKCIFGLLYYYIVLHYYIVVALLQEQRKVWSLWRDLCRCIWIYLDAFETTLSPNVLFYGVIESQVNMDCGRKNSSIPPSLAIDSEWQEYSRWRLDMGLLLALGGWTCFRLMCTLGTQDQAVHRLFSFFFLFQAKLKSLLVCHKEYSSLPYNHLGLPGGFARNFNMWGGVGWGEVCQRWCSCVHMVRCWCVMCKGVTLGVEWGGVGWGVVTFVFICKHGHSVPPRNFEPL